MKEKKKKHHRGVLIFLAVLLFVVVSFYFYVSDDYRADQNAVEAMKTDKTNIHKQGNMTIIYPDKRKDIKTAFIFYPGAKVEDSAYTPLLEKLSKQGITCVLLKMPLKLAVFDFNAAEGVYKALPGIKNWYIGGHSLGGAMASIYTALNQNKIKGLILLGAYPVFSTSVKTIAIYGSEDKVLNKSKLNEVKDKYMILGGNHAYYGDYGEQKGDGKAVITREQQQNQTVAVLFNFIQSNK